MRAVLFALVLVCVASGSVPAHARAPEFREINMAVMNEAEGEPFESKLAHAYMFFNRARAGMSLGSSNLYSTKVVLRLARASESAWADSTRACHFARENPDKDITRGAVYCENVKKFGVPAHIRRAGKSVVPTVKIGDVQFWKKTT